MSKTLRLTSPKVAALQTALTHYPESAQGDGDTDASDVLDLLEAGES